MTECSKESSFNINPFSVFQKGNDITRHVHLKDNCIDQIKMMQTQETKRKRKASVTQNTTRTQRRRNIRTHVHREPLQPDLQEGQNLHQRALAVLPARALKSLHRVRDHPSRRVSLHHSGTMVEVHTMQRKAQAPMT